RRAECGDAAAHPNHGKARRPVGRRADGVGHLAADPAEAAQATAAARTQAQPAPRPSGVRRAAAPAALAARGLPRPGAAARLVTAIPEGVGMAVVARTLASVVLVLATAGCGGQRAHTV